MKFNDFVSAALSNDIIAIVDDPIRGKFTAIPRPAYKWIDDPEYADREINRFTIWPRTEFDNRTGGIMAVTLK